MNIGIERNMGDIHAKRIKGYEQFFVILPYVKTYVF